MSLFHTVKQFLSGPPTRRVAANSPTVSVADPELPTSPANDWETTTGRLHHPQQERNVTYHNSEISGTCTGKIGELNGSAMVGLFEDLPTWLPSLLIRVTVRVADGDLTASIRESSGAIGSVVAPGTVECNAELVAGRVWLRCESGPLPARGIQYEVIII